MRGVTRTNGKRGIDGPARPGRRFVPRQEYRDSEPADASRFLIGLVTCFARHGGIPAQGRSGAAPPQICWPLLQPIHPARCDHFQRRRPDQAKVVSRSLRPRPEQRDPRRRAGGQSGRADPATEDSWEVRICARPRGLCGRSCVPVLRCAGIRHGAPGSWRPVPHRCGRVDPR